MNKNDEISREHFDNFQIQRENQIQQKFHDDLTPAPSGRRFLSEFKIILQNHYLVTSLPYMDSISLNKDIILYRAMMMILSYVIGKNHASQTVIKKIVKFMSSNAMISLRDNSFASNEHENASRSVCLQFLKDLSH